jgi:hypothetical protein
VDEGQDVEDRLTALEARVVALQLAVLPLARPWWSRLWWVLTGR